MRMLFGLHVSYIVVIQMIYLYVLHSMSQKHVFVCLFVCLFASTLSTQVFVELWHVTGCISLSVPLAFNGVSIVLDSGFVH